mmetsp:Transcript_118072/g.345819  ORF Transcript_118072/g.345819 Transcript_118072/m.345819 type:complete len:212 (+) Transcript_118072:286-921(+)
MSTSHMTATFTSSWSWRPAARSRSKWRTPGRQDRRSAKACSGAGSQTWPARWPTCTGAGSCIGTSSPRTCSWARAGRRSWATSASPRPCPPRRSARSRAWARPSTCLRRSFEARATPSARTSGAWAAPSTSSPQATPPSTAPTRTSMRWATRSARRATPLCRQAPGRRSLWTWSVGSLLWSPPRGQTRSRSWTWPTGGSWRGCMTSRCWAR